MRRLICFIFPMIILGGCNENTENWNRGIGVYPGNPEENFSPEMIVDDEYRNIALHRAAYNSSSYDYCLTANLISDGIIEESAPKHLEVLIPEGEPIRREREWLLDEHEYTRVDFYGENPYVIINLKNGWKEKFDRLYFDGYVSYLAKNASGKHNISVSVTDNGEDWTEIKAIKGVELPGVEIRPRRHTDPDKADALGEQLLPTRWFRMEIELPESIEFTGLRVDMSLEGAEMWTYKDIHLFNEEDALDMISSKFFNSTWMSLGWDKEWVYVDLGNRAQFDKVVLHWLNKPVSGWIQVSNDAKKWRNLCELPSSEKMKDEIEVKGKGRYVRVLMDKSENAAPYMLTEMEVWGRGGLVAVPKPSPEPTDKEIILSGGNWKLSRGEKGENADWLTATVPGTILTSHVNLGAVPNPNFGSNMLNISDSYFNSDFWYKTEFEISEEFLNGRTWLEFDGINWKAEVYLNEAYLGKIEGAFTRGRFDISEIAEPGMNQLLVKIIKNANPGAVKEKNAENTGLNGGVLGHDNPTFHASIGWDWISTTRGRNRGIWNDVRIVKEGEVSLDAPYVNVVLPLPDTTSAELRTEILVKNNSQSPVEGLLKGKIGDIEFSQSVCLKGGEEKNIIFSPTDYPQLVMQNPALWWPNGYGEQSLYEAEFEFVIDDKVSDSEKFNVGIRQVETNIIDDVLFLYVNGRRFIGRGGNWGFSESNLNYRAREYDIAVEYHANCNFNIMRNWVGQTGDKELYEACDRHGIMVWQDFWLANPADGPNPGNEAMFMQNAEDLVKRIRRHPSMLIYCGRNEGYPPASLDENLRELVKNMHSDLAYISSSADECVSGHGPYNARTPIEYFTFKQGNDKFHSERGMPNVMTYESMQRTYSEEALWPQSVEWYQHDYTLSGAQRCESFNEIINTGYGESASAKEFAQNAQFVNYDGYRAMFESRSKNRKGFLLWMSHPCWPSMTWQTYDWYFETNGGYFGSKKGAEPIHIQWNPATDEIEVVNYNGKDRTGLTVKAILMNTDGELVWEKVCTTDSKEDSTVKCFKLEYPETLSETYFIKLILSQGNETVSDNFYINGKEYGNHQSLKEMKKAKIKSAVKFEKGEDGIWKGVVTIINKGKVPCLMVRLNLVGRSDSEQILPAFYQDNYFSLLPGEKKVVSIKCYDADTRGNRPEVDITGYNL